MEKSFSLHHALTALYTTTKAVRKKHHIELIYEIGKTIPRELKGDSSSLVHILEATIGFLCENSHAKEIVLSLSAPEDFLYEEMISFKIEKTGIPKEKIFQFLSQTLKDQIDALHGEIVYDIPEGIHIDLPFQVVEIGRRRNFRLPDDYMLDKKVLILCPNGRKALSIQKMFEYFHYEVDVGLDGYQRSNSDLGTYDILVLDESLANKEIQEAISPIQLHNKLKLVLIKECEEDETNLSSTHLCMPVTQESIFHLITKLFEEPVQRKNPSKHYPIDLEKLLSQRQSLEEAQSHTIGTIIPSKLKTEIENLNYASLAILDTKKVVQHAKMTQTHYQDTLQEFIETFGHSDVYLKDIILQKDKDKIEEFCFYLEKKSKEIGALRAEKLAQIIAIIVKHEQNLTSDMLTMYAHKYHIELKNLINTINEN